MTADQSERVSQQANGRRCSTILGSVRCLRLYASEPAEVPDMRAILVAILVALSLPGAAIAQSDAPANPAPAAQSAPRSARGGDITKEEYVERARHAAERRFDKMDTNHDGVLTADERRAAREARAQRRAARSQSQ